MGKSFGLFNDCVNISWRSHTLMLYAEAILEQRVIFVRRVGFSVQSVA
jgi:hypothetical protein